MKVVGVCGRKGGSGKTTIAVHLAAEFASRGRSVILVDCDPQGSANHWSQPGGLPMPVHHRPLESGESPKRWAEAVQGFGGDLLVLDSPPHLDPVAGVVIGLSDLVVLPCGPSGLDLLATAETVALVREIRIARGDGQPRITLVPNRVDLRTSSGRQLEAALGDLGEDVSPAIHARTALADSFNLGAWVGAYSPGSAAHVEVQQLATHVLTLLGQKPGKKKS